MQESIRQELKAVRHADALIHVVDVSVRGISLLRDGSILMTRNRAAPMPKAKRREATILRMISNGSGKRLCSGSRAT